MIKDCCITSVYSDFLNYINNMVIETAFNLVEIKIFEFSLVLNFVAEYIEMFSNMI